MKVHNHRSNQKLLLTLNTQKAISALSGMMPQEQFQDRPHVNKDKPVRLLDTSGGGCGLASGLGGQLLAGCLAAGGLAGCLLGASHALCLLIAEGMNVKGNAQESFADQEIVVSFVSACVR